ncbi:putative very-long-chain enoyl-CoA reductase art-1 [Brevipalpus obovatus]|uniref:putative very-long-chain enoyl-CoA reductase art-1 n=1 Tax=Brevipalpus obovatus TaxID=246614 RepID=UPI003D9EE5C1
MDLEIFTASSNERLVVSLKNVSPSRTVRDIKELIHREKKSLYPARQSLRLEIRGKSLKDEQQLKSFSSELKDGKIIFLKDLGHQIGWKTVFLWEYAGPLFCYLITYMRPELIYGKGAPTKPMHQVVQIAAVCWTFHYIKRILETLFVHRFSHGYMPILNLLKNCTYYWGFAFYIGYYINHPLYTPAYFGRLQINAALAGFIFSELGNFSIHIALRSLRPAGTKERKIPVPTENPFTLLFDYVSCPNYTYEVMSWVSFSILTQCLPAAIFTALGGTIMTIWALGKHRNYRREFPNYPKYRKAIFPFII